MICSFIPGRIRLRSPRFREADNVSALVAILKEQPGMLKIENNPNTGSLLIHYDPEKIDQESALKALALLQTDEERLADDESEPESDCSEAALSLPQINKEAVEYLGMIGAFAVCTSSAFLRSKGLHVYSGLALAGLTVQHIYKYRKRLQRLLSNIVDG